VSYVLLLLLQVTEEMVWELFIQAGPVGQSSSLQYTNKGASFAQQLPHMSCNHISTGCLLG
jgi:hypothetical protein